MHAVYTQSRDPHPERERRGIVQEDRPFCFAKLMKGQSYEEQLREPGFFSLEKRMHKETFLLPTTT